jgi:hypothetical protein
MGTVLIVTLLVFGVFVGIPLWLTQPSAAVRVSRLERALGTETGQPSRWVWGLTGGIGATYTILGVRSLVRGDRVVGVVYLISAPLGARAPGPVLDHASPKITDRGRGRANSRPSPKAGP